jgi:hypothetical protein
VDHSYCRQDWTGLGDWPPDTDRIGSAFCINFRDNGKKKKMPENDGLKGKGEWGSPVLCMVRPKGMLHAGSCCGLGVAIG